MRYLWQVTNVYTSVGGWGWGGARFVSAPRTLTVSFTWARRTVWTHSCFRCREYPIVWISLNIKNRCEHFGGCEGSRPLSCVQSHQAAEGLRSAPAKCLNNWELSKTLDDLLHRSRLAMNEALVVQPPPCDTRTGVRPSDGSVDVFKATSDPQRVEGAL